MFMFHTLLDFEAFVIHDLVHLQGQGGHIIELFPNLTYYYIVDLHLTRTFHEKIQDNQVIIPFLFNLFHICNIRNSLHPTLAE